MPPRDFSPLLVALAPHRWCGGGVFCCACVGTIALGHCRSIVASVPRNAHHLRPASALSRLPLLRLAVHRAPHLSKNTGCCGKKRTAFDEKSTGFCANTTTFHKDKHRAKEKPVKRNFKLPSADKDMPHFHLGGRSVEGRTSPLSCTERAHFVAGRPLPKNDTAQAHTLRQSSPFPFERPKKISKPVALLIHTFTEKPAQNGALFSKNIAVQIFTR